MPQKSRLRLLLCVLSAAVVLVLPWLAKSSKPPQAVAVTTPAAAIALDAAPPPAGILAADKPTERVPDRAIFASAWGRGGHAALDAFAAWTEEYLSAAPDARPALLARGRELAAARRAALLELIKTDPRSALANTPPIRIRNQLPTDIQALLEERVSGVGNVGLIYAVPLPGSTERIPPVDIALIGGRQFEAHRYGQRKIPTGLASVSIHGIALDRHLAVSDSPVKVMEPGETYTEVSEDCVVTDNKQILAPGDTPDQKSTALLGTHAYVMCCPYCITTFDAEKIEAESNAYQTPMGLADSGIPGTQGFPGKPAASRTHGGKGVIIFRVQPSDGAFPSWATDAHFLDVINRGDGWNERIKLISYGKTWFSRTDVTPVLTLPGNTAYYTGNGYEWGRWIDDSKAAATAAGYDMANYSTYVVAHQGYGQFNAAGWGDTTGAGVIWANGNFDVRLFVHEGGHTYGLPHANSWTSTDGNPVSPSRAHVEYGDDSDPMGNAWAGGFNNEYNAYYKSYCSWLPDSSVLSVSHPGTYRIRQFDGGQILTGSPLALKISRDSDMDYWVMYRGSTIPQSAYNTGAYVVGVPVGRVGDSHVIDMNDATGNTANAPLSQGQVFADTAAGITLTTSGRGGVAGDRYVYVKVDFAPGYTGPHRLLVNGGIYGFRNKSFDRYLAVPGNSSTAGVEPVLATFANSPAQQWVVSRNADGTYSFNHLGTDKWLDVSGNGNANYTEIIQWTRNELDAQRFELLLMADGLIKFRKRGTEQMLTADTAANNSGDIITYRDFWPGNEQRWDPVLLGMSEGDYRLSPRHAQVFGLGVRGQSALAGAAAEQQAWSGAATQRWTLQSVGVGQFRIYPQDQSGLALSIAGGSTATGAKAVLAPYTGASSQKWTFANTGNGWVRLAPAHAPAASLQVSGAATTGGTGLELAPYSGATHQQWKFVDPDL